MANRIPLIINAGSAQIQELASGDVLLLTNNDIQGVENITAAGAIVAAANVQGGNIRTAGTVSATGNVTGNYFIGNGSQLTGLSVGSTSNISNGTSNVAIGVSGGNVTVGVAGTSNVAVFGTNTITVNANLLPSANVTYDLGSPSQRFNDLYLAGNTIDLGGALISANATSVVITNPAGGTFTLQGSGATSTYSNANVQAYLPTYTGNLAGGNTAVTGAVTATTVSTTGNVTGSYILGNGAFLTGVAASYSNANVATYLPTYTGNLGGGNAVISGAVTGATVSTTGNITGSNLITGGNVLATGAVSATGNITGSYILGNGSQLTGLPATYSNANVQAYLPTYSGNIGALLANGNIQVVNGIFIGNGAGLTGVTASSNVGSASKLSNGTTEFNIPVANGNVVGNIGGVTNVYTFASTGMSVVGNVTANYFIGNGSQLTGLPASYADSNVATFLAAFGSNTISTTGTVTAGNVTGGNLLTGGLISATGNVTGNYILGNGSLLTGVSTSS